mmetsp:Transcript_11684/g.33736  ORF Transcript_11684/g.33736 Transcript_11684/m.33736 type:complete len:90 (+) Transcript_11684:503-772(+)
MPGLNLETWIGLQRQLLQRLLLRCPGRLAPSPAQQVHQERELSSPTHSFTVQQEKSSEGLTRQITFRPRRPRQRGSGRSQGRGVRGRLG